MRTIAPILAMLPLLAGACAGPSASTVPREKYEEEMVDGMIKIPQGWFTMGWDLGELNERPEHEVFLSTFWIDRYEVSAAQFAEFLHENGNDDDIFFVEDKYSTIESFGEGRKRSYRAREGYENHPANNVTWTGADAYCRMQGKRLPAEAEWEKAARSDDKRMYPWGSEPPDEGKARYGKSWESDGLDVMAPVDSYPEGASYYGIHHLAGNIWEWTADWYRQNYCDYCGDYEGSRKVATELTGGGGAISSDGQVYGKSELPPRRNPTGPDTGSFKVLRGGSWYDQYGEAVMRSTYRYWFEPEGTFLSIGLRCAR